MLFAAVLSQWRLCLDLALAFVVLIYNYIFFLAMLETSPFCPLLRPQPHPPLLNSHWPVTQAVLEETSMQSQAIHGS